MKINTIRLLVGDFTAAFRFWRDVMQFPVVYGKEDNLPSELEYAYFTAGEIGFELSSRDQFAAAIGEATPTPTPVGRQAIISLQSDDVDATYADLVARGATAVSAPADHADWGARTGYISDPENNLIEIYTSLHPAEAQPAEQ